MSEDTYERWVQLLLNFRESFLFQQLTSMAGSLYYLRLEVDSFYSTYQLIGCKNAWTISLSSNIVNLLPETLLTSANPVTHLPKHCEKLKLTCNVNQRKTMQHVVGLYSRAWCARAVHSLFFSLLCNAHSAPGQLITHIVPVSHLKSS